MDYKNKYLKYKKKYINLKTNILTGGGRPTLEEKQPGLKKYWSNRIHIHYYDNKKIEPSKDFTKPYSKFEDIKFYSITPQTPQTPQPPPKLVRLSGHWLLRTNN